MKKPTLQHSTSRIKQSLRLRAWLRTLLFALVGVWFCSATAHSQGILPTISSLDVPRYLGRWYEIAKFPNRFQKQCVSDTSADYALTPDGKLSVLNQCRVANGEWDKAVGLAKQVGDSQSAKLQVRFAPAWLSFLPFVWGDYWIVDLDDKYELVAISEPRREYLWILSRTPAVDEATYKALLNRLTIIGLDVKKLEKSPQPLATRQP